MKFATKMSKKDKHFLDRAIEVAKIPTCKFKHGAIIVKNGNPLGVGINHTINDPYFLTDEVAAKHAAVHAEVAALTACKKSNVEGATIYVARVLKNGEPRMSKPCVACQNALKAAGIKKVFYTIDSEMDL